MIRLESYVCGRWQAGRGEGRPFVNPTTGEPLGFVDSTGVDFQAGVTYARRGGAALRAMTFAERGALLKSIADALSAGRDRYLDIARLNSGNTKVDAGIDIDGGIGTLRYYARTGTGLGATRLIVESGVDRLAREDVFGARHVWSTRPGVAVHINAYNFPSWGLWEKVAVALLAGVPVIAKPASSTAWLSHEMVRDVVACNLLPDGALSLVCGSSGDLVDHLGPYDGVLFTGSADTGRKLRNLIPTGAAAPRLAIEADSVNATILGPDVGAGSALNELFRREVAKALSVKAGQLCTNIRRILVPKQQIREMRDGIVADLDSLVVGDPTDGTVNVGPLVDVGQRDIALAKLEQLKHEAKVVRGGGRPDATVGADPQRGAFLAPTLLHLEDAGAGQAVHQVEVFGPVATLIPYTDLDHASDLATAGGGSLAVSLFSDDISAAVSVIGKIGHAHGRIMVVDTTVGKAHSGHAIVMPQCVHGGPGRAGGGEELGGVRGLRFYMQRTAVQGSPRLQEHIGGGAIEAAL